MHVNKLPCYKDHWSDNPYLGTRVSEIMPKSRYENLKSFLHLNSRDPVDINKLIDATSYKRFELLLLLPR